MLLPTLPRTLACGDRLKNARQPFATGEGIRNVKISVASEGPVAVAGDDVQTLRFEVPAEKNDRVRIVLRPDQNGQATVTITATDGAYRVCETVHIDVRNPLPDVVEVQRHRLSGSDEHRFAWKPFTEGQVRLEIASIPSIDFAGAFSFVENYAHLCTEQLSSRAMYMLYARRFLDDEARQRADKAFACIVAHALVATARRRRIRLLAGTYEGARLGDLYGGRGDDRSPSAGFRCCVAGSRTLGWLPADGDP